MGCAVRWDRAERGARSTIYNRLLLQNSTAHGSGLATRKDNAHRERHAHTLTHFLVLAMFAGECRATQALRVPPAKP